VANNYTYGIGHNSSNYEDKEFFEAMQEFAQHQLYRNTTAAQWEEIASLLDPPSRNTFFYGTYNWPGQKLTQRQVDATGMVSLHRFGAILDSLLTPRNMFWHGLEADDPYVMKDRDTQLWFEQATRILFKARYAPIANFSSQNQNNYQGLGAYGTAGMFIDSFQGHDPRIKGLRYKSIPLGQLFIRENHQGLVDGFIRWWRMTARQCMQKWPNRFPEELRPALEQNSEQPYDFIHRVCPRDDYDPQRLDARGKLFKSQYFCIQSKTMLQEEGGYNTFPIACSRYDQTPNELYGRSPAMMVLPALKTLNAQKKSFLKQAHRAADPVLLTADDGLVDMSLRPGSMNKGGVSSDGKLMVHVLPTGEIQISKEAMAEEKGLIQDVFLVALFQIMEKSPTMTATEVIERVNEKGILLAPTVGRQQSEYLGPMIERELDVLSSQRLLPPMPPRLREAGGAYSTVYTSPLSKAMKSQETAGFMRVMSSLQEVVKITGDTSYFDRFNFDVIVPAMSEQQSVPASWMSSDKQVAAKAQARAQAQQRQQQIEAAPAKAALMNAQTKQAAAGQAQPQQPGQAPAQQAAPQGA